MRDPLKVERRELKVEGRMKMAFEGRAMIRGGRCGGRGVRARTIAAGLLVLGFSTTDASTSISARAASSEQSTPAWLRVSDDRRHLVTEDGRPFFWLADTAWEMFHRLTREETEEYMSNRAAKGFTVIQAVALAEYNFSKPNAYGHLPLADRDPARPLDPYFRDVDRAIACARRHGLHVGLLPTWGDKWNKTWAPGPEIFTPENAETYGEWLGRRYRNEPAIVWILGGDRPVQTERHYAIIRAMARGLQRGDGGRHLITFHPVHDGESWFHADPWLAFDMFQSGHRMHNKPNYERNLANWKLEPPKPTLEGEPCYEDHPVRTSTPDDWFDAYDVRKAAYWSLLSGACGHTYGNHNIWQFLDPSRDEPVFRARTPWRIAMDQPGAVQMGIMKRFFVALPWQKLQPDDSLLAFPPGTGGEHVQCARAADGGFAVAYTPTGRALEIQLSRLTGKRLRATWFDPRSGQWQPPEEFDTNAATPTKTLRPPTSGPGRDWVLLIEDTEERRVTRDQGPGTSP